MKFDNKSDDFLCNMPAEKREKVLRERIKRRVAIMAKADDKEYLLSFYEDRAMFYGRLWDVLQRLDEKGKL